MINPSDPARSNDNYTCVASNGVLPDKKKSMTTGTAVTVVHCKFMFGCYCENAQWFINVCELLPKMAWNLRKIHLCHNIFLLHVWSSISFCVNRSTPYLRMQLKCWNNYLCYINRRPAVGYLPGKHYTPGFLTFLLAIHRLSRVNGWMALELPAVSESYWLGVLSWITFVCSLQAVTIDFCWLSVNLNFYCGRKRLPSSAWMMNDN